MPWAPSGRSSPPLLLPGSRKDGEGPPLCSAASAVGASAGFWWAVGIGTPLLMLGLGIVFVGVWGQQWPDFSPLHLPPPPRTTFWLADGVLTGILYGVCEEVGWRGFALPRLQRRWNALVSTLILFGIWAAFHIPFFLYRYPFGLGSLVGFLLGLFAGAVWLTYLYNSTGGSALITMVWHSLFNVVNAIALVALPPAAAVMSVLAVLLGIAALVIGKPIRLSSARATQTSTPGPHFQCA